MKHLIRKILKENINQKIIDTLKRRKINYTDFEDINNFLEPLGYTEKEIGDVFAEYFEMETGFKIFDYSKSKNFIMVGSRTNFLHYMVNKYDHIKGKDEIYFFDGGYHFGTLYKMGRFMELHHDGTLDEYGRRKVNN
jgi:hypothetical protein